MLFVVQIDTKTNLEDFRAGLGSASGVLALGIDPRSFWKLGGIDAFYLSLTQAEEYGSSPLPVHQIGILYPTLDQQKDGAPGAILTGFVLDEDDPDTCDFVVPQVLRALVTKVNLLNTTRATPLRTIGLFQSIFSPYQTDIRRVGKLFADVLGNEET